MFLTIRMLIASYLVIIRLIKSIGKLSKKGYKEVFTGLPDKLKKQLEDDKVSIGYSGYMYSYPDWFIRKKSAYIALRDALKQCEEFMDNIKSLL